MKRRLTQATAMKNTNKLKGTPEYKRK